MKHRWNPDNFETIGKIMREFAKLRSNIGPRIKDIDPTKLEHIYEVIKQVCQEIEAIVQEKPSF
ncbi:MAG: hypothetical protein FJW69_00595 [Actinobacteria bacterium]|nr:hypothetical protein [Actinomycetota bacterium]